MLYIILAVFIALFLAVFQYIFKSKEKSQLNYWLSFLRFLSLFCIFLVFINPSIVKKEIETIKPNLIVAIDNSASIKYNNQNNKIVELIDVLKSNSSLNNTYEVDYFTFGERVGLLDSLSFIETQTNISTPLQNFSKTYKDGVNQVVLITDGNTTTGSNVVFLNYNSPIYPVIVGDTTIVDDISIERLNLNSYSFINNQFPVEIFMNYSGNENISKKLVVFHKGKKVYSEVFNFSKVKNSQIANFYLTAEESGVQFYSAQIESLEQEKNTINNTKTFSVNVIEESSNILIVTSILHPDLGMFKKAIESNKQRKVTIENINNSELNISDYQLVIAYQPNSKFKEVFSEINTKKINYFIISGNRTDWKFLNSIQTIFQKEIVTATEDYMPIFNEDYATFISNDIGFSEFPPLTNQFGQVTFEIPFQTLLFQKIGVIETTQPLLATFEKDSQKGGFLFGEGSWRWRMYSFNATKSFESFDSFIANLMQYLTSSLKNKRLNVTVNPLYYSNETILFTGSYLDKNLNFDARAKLWLTVTNKKTNYVNRIPFAVQNSRFVAELSNLPTEEYDFSVSIENQTERAFGKFKILPFEIEQQFSQSNDKNLKILAKKTTGELFYINQQSALIETLLKSEHSKSIQKSKTIKKPIIDWKWILGIIIFLLSIEWFIRKYFGKI